MRIRAHGVVGRVDDSRKCARGRERGRDRRRDVQGVGVAGRDAVAKMDEVEGWWEREEGC